MLFRKCFALLLSAMLLLPAVTLADPEIDLSAISDDDLFTLEVQILNEKLSRGLPVSATLMTGSYTIGEDGDIPPARYAITCLSADWDWNWVDVLIGDEKGEIIVSKLIDVGTSYSIDFPEKGKLWFKEPGAIKLVPVEKPAFK